MNGKSVRFKWIINRLHSLANRPVWKEKDREREEVVEERTLKRKKKTQKWWML